MEDEDLQMIEAVLQGNQPAFQRLVERCQYFVFTIAMRIVKSREEAEEVAQDVFLKVYKTLGQFEKKSKFSTWLYTVTWRTSIDQARRKQILTDSIDDEEGAFWQVATPDETPLQAVQHGDLQQQLQQAIQQLRPEDAALITLYYLNEKSVKEIADITGLTETNIKTKLYRIRELLREYLDTQLQEEIKDML